MAGYLVYAASCRRSAQTLKAELPMLCWLPSRPQQQQQCRGICKFVRRLEHARRKRRMVDAGAFLFNGRKKAGAYVSTPDPLSNRLANYAEYAIVNNIDHARFSTPSFNTVSHNAAAPPLCSSPLPAFKGKAASDDQTIGNDSVPNGKIQSFFSSSGSPVPLPTMLHAGGKGSNVERAQMLGAGAQHQAEHHFSSCQPPEEDTTRLHEHIQAQTSSTVSEGVLRPVYHIPLPSGRAPSKHLHRIASMPSLKHMMKFECGGSRYVFANSVLRGQVNVKCDWVSHAAAYLLLFSKTAIRPPDTYGYLAVLRRLAADASLLDCRSLWRACAAVRNFRKSREWMRTVEERGTAEQPPPVELEQRERGDLLQKSEAVREPTAVEKSTQLQKQLLDEEEAVIDAFVRAAAVLLQKRVDLRLASRLLSCFALDFRVLYLPFYAHVSLNFTRQQLRASAEELAETAFAFASVQLRDRFLFAKIAEAAESILSCFTIAQLSRLLLSFVLVGIQCSSLLVAAAPYLERLSSQCCAEEIGRIAFTHARAGLCPSPVRRLLAARIPTALSALRNPSQIADLLVSAQQLQLQLPDPLQVHVAHQLQLNDLDGQSFAAVLLALLPLRRLSPIFWQDAAASCLLRLLISTPASERKALLLQVQGIPFSDKDNSDPCQDASASKSYSESPHALSSEAIVDCFTCFATIFGGSLGDAGSGGAADTEQHNCFAVVLAGLSHALCSSRRGDNRCQPSNVEHSYEALFIDMLPPADVVRLYRALRRMRSSWDVERQRWHIEAEVQGDSNCLCMVQSDGDTLSTRPTAGVPESAARPHCRSDARRRPAEGMGDTKEKYSPSPSASLPLRKLTEGGRIMEDQFSVSTEEQHLPRDLRNRCAYHLLGAQTVAFRRFEDSSVRTGAKSMGSADAALEPTTEEDHFVPVDLNEWTEGVVTCAQQYWARVANLQIQARKRSVGSPLLYAEDMAMALACHRTQRYLWHSLERALMRRLLLTLNSDTLSFPDLLACAYSVFCLYPYAKVTEFLPSSPSNTTEDGLPESSVIALVCQRVVAALHHIYLGAQHDGGWHAKQHYCRRVTPQFGAGQTAVKEAFSTLAPDQQHAVSSLLSRHVPGMPSFLSKALPRLAETPLTAGGSGCRNTFSSSGPNSAGLAESRSHVFFTSPTVGAEVGRLLQSAGINVQHMHSTDATNLPCCAANSSNNALKCFAEQYDRAECPPSRRQVSIVSYGNSNFTRDELWTGAVSQLSSPCSESVQAVDHVAARSAACASESTAERPTSTAAVMHSPPSFSGIPIPHVASGGGKALYALKSEVGARLRLLQAEGWQLVYVPFCTWTVLRDETEKLTYLLDQRRHLVRQLESEASCENFQASFQR